MLEEEGEDVLIEGRTSGEMGGGKSSQLDFEEESWRQKGMLNLRLAWWSKPLQTTQMCNLVQSVLLQLLLCQDLRM